MFLPKSLLVPWRLRTGWGWSSTWYWTEASQNPMPTWQCQQLGCMSSSGLGIEAVSYMGITLGRGREMFSLAWLPLIWIFTLPEFARQHLVLHFNHLPITPSYVDYVFLLLSSHVNLATESLWIYCKVDVLLVEETTRTLSNNLRHVHLILNSWKRIADYTQIRIYVHYTFMINWKEVTKRRREGITCFLFAEFTVHIVTAQGFRWEIRDHHLNLYPNRNFLGELAFIINFYFGNFPTCAQEIMW